MTPEEILAHPPCALSQARRESYFEDGYLALEAVVPPERLASLRAARDEVVERSRLLTDSDDTFVLETGHTSAGPRLRRLNRAADNHPAFWEHASQSILPDIVSDLVGPDVSFREAMLNFKWRLGGDPVGWHQDIPFYPHTNMTPLITLTFLEDVDEEMGPLAVIPGSHKLGLFEHYDAEDRWAGCISEADLATVPLEAKRTITGPAGSVAIIHGAMIHGSARNESKRSRPLLICGYGAADAFRYTPLWIASRYLDTIVRGHPARFAHQEPMQIRLPPDLSDSYSSLFETQQKKERAAG